MFVATSAFAQPADPPPPLDPPKQPDAPKSPPLPKADDPKPPDGAPSTPPDEPSDATYGGFDVPPTPESKLPPRTDLAAGEKRPKQDIDGREDVTTTAEDALWIPRVAFFPLYLVSEYILRIPLGALVVAVERSNLISTLQKAFTFGPNNNIGVVPTAFLDFGFRPSVGVYAFYNDFIAPGNDLRANVGFGGIKFWRAGLADRIPIDTPVGNERAKSYFQIESDFLTRSDLLFWGIGPDRKDTTKSTYSLFTIGGGGRIHLEPWRGTFFEGWVTARYVETGAGACDDSTTFVTDDAIGRICTPGTIRRRIQDGAFPIPPQYGRPYVTVKSGIRAAVDSRRPRPEPGSGVAFEAMAEHVSDVDDPALGGWINYSGVLGGFLDITGTQRVLGLTLAAHMQDPLRDETNIPFTELVGAKHIEDVPDLDIMRGFQPGRLLGHSAVAATLEYRWPIWAFIDGTLQAAVGNAFNESHLEDFEFDKLRFSFVGGIRSPNHRDHSFNLLVGFGTDTFEQGGAVSAIRFVFGGTTGF